MSYYVILENILIGLICFFALFINGRVLAYFLWALMSIIIGHAYYRATIDGAADGFKFNPLTMLYTIFTAPFTFTNIAISYIRQEIDPNYNDDGSDYFTMYFEDENKKEDREDNEDDTKT